MRLVHFLSIAGLAALTATAVQAQQPGAGPGQGPVALKCNDDIAKLCPGKQHGSGEARACLTANKAKVSAACREALETTGPGKGQGKGQGQGMGPGGGMGGGQDKGMGQGRGMGKGMGRRAIRRACVEDMTKLCAGKSHRRGEMRACLVANKEKASAGCREALETAGPGMGKGQGGRRGGRRAVMRNCADDMAKHCAGKSHRRGEMRACLVARKDQVSAACREALDSTGRGRGRRGR